MTKNKLSQQGFSAIEGLLVLIVLLLVGFIGYYVYHANSKTTDTYNAASDTAAKPVVVKKSGQSNTSTSAQKYLTIKEWGVRIPYNTPYTLEYAMLMDNSAVGLSTDKIVAADSNCSAANSALGGISRFKPTDATDDEGTTAAEAAKSPDAAKHAYVNGYYYFYNGPQSSCASSSSNTNSDTLQTDENQEIRALVPLMEVSN